MIEAAAWPKAQALTSWAKSTILPSSMTRSTITVEPHSFECALAVAPGAGRRPWRGIFAARSRIWELYISVSMGVRGAKVRVTTEFEYYIGARGLGDEIWRISERSSRANVHSAHPASGADPAPERGREAPSDFGGEARDAH